MLDFRHHRRSANHPGLALERRLLALVIGSALVVFLIVGAGNPRNWGWLLPGAQAGAPPGRPPDESQPRVVGEPKKTPDKLFPGVRSDYLATVRDDTVFRPAESDAWFHLWELVARTSNDDLARATEGPVAYLQLDQQPKEYRGRLVTISGTARAAKLVPAPKNAFGVDKYYQLWIQPDPSSPALIALYCHGLPEGFPLGERIDAECSAVGFFFKRWAYQSQGGIATAPLVIAKTLHWQPTTVAAAPRATFSPAEQLVLAAIVALALALFALAFIVRRGRATAKHRAAGDSAADVGSALAEIANKPHTEG
jgi:hypothetical protein